MNKYEEAFWLWWIKGSDYERVELIKKLIIYDNKAAVMLKSDPSGHTFATVLNSYFEDLVEVLRKEEAAG